MGKRGEEHWTLVIERELHHRPAKVWRALTEPAQLREWAPYDSDRNLGIVGTATLTTVGAPSPHVTEAQITRADPPRALEFTWGGQPVRWELEPVGDGGTRLRLFHSIDRRFIAMGAAGWHVCLDVMNHLLDEDPLGRIVGMDAMKLEGWNQLHNAYIHHLGDEA